MEGISGGRESVFLVCVSCSGATEAFLVLQAIHSLF